MPNLLWYNPAKTRRGQAWLLYIAHITNRSNQLANKKRDAAPAKADPDLWQFVGKDAAASEPQLYGRKFARLKDKPKSASEEIPSD